MDEKINENFSEKPELISGLNETPCFQTEEKKFLLLNIALAVKMAGVTYHLLSFFDGKKELGDVIDTIELERNSRRKA